MARVSCRNTTATYGCSWPNLLKLAQPSAGGPARRLSHLRPLLRHKERPRLSLRALRLRLRLRLCRPGRKTPRSAFKRPHRTVVGRGHVGIYEYSRQPTGPQPQNRTATENRVAAGNAAAASPPPGGPGGHLNPSNMLLISNPYLPLCLTMGCTGYGHNADRAARGPRGSAPPRLARAGLQSGGRRNTDLGEDCTGFGLNRGPNLRL